MGEGSFPQPGRLKATNTTDKSTLPLKAQLSGLT